jgi:hypothetical protein
MKEVLVDGHVFYWRLLLGIGQPDVEGGVRMIPGNALFADPVL